MKNDLISRSALEQSFDDGCVGECGCCEHHHERHVSFGNWEEWCKLVRNAPTIDAVEVVHGRWVETGKVFVHSMYDLFTKCSLCSFGHVRNEYQEPYHYCPNCGAKMDGGASDGSDT